MLLIALLLLALVWTLVFTILLGLCRSAATGDEAIARAIRSRGEARDGPSAAGA
jgi:hypothetical protein